MDTRLGVLESLRKEFEIDKNVSFGTYLSYVTSSDDLAYMPDEEIKRLVDWDVEIRKDYPDDEIGPGDCNWEFRDAAHYLLTHEKEQTAYERYMAHRRGKTLFQLEERLSYYDFLKRFADEYNCYKGCEDYTKPITVINHNTDFYNIVPYRYIPMYVCARKGDNYTFLDTNSNKIPDAHELFCFIESGQCLYYAPMIDRIQVSLKVEADEWFALVFDAEGNVRAASYYKWAHFGMAVRPDKKEIEFYDRHQAMKMFHELFGRCQTFIEPAKGEYSA